jgi:hypothetical protein
MIRSHLNEWLNKTDKIDLDMREVRNEDECGFRPFGIDPNNE